MPRYVRSDCPGSTYFFTARAARRGTDLFLREIDPLRAAMRKTREMYPFSIEEIVVLGDVIHTLWRLPEGDADFSTRWRMLKSLFSRSVDAPQDVGALRLRAGEKGLWQRRFWEHVIRDGDDLAAHRYMIFSAPVQAGLVNRPEDWPHSSIHRAIAQGRYIAGGPVGRAYRPLPTAGRTARAPYDVRHAVV
ncbi:transposase [uncultured Tateyamaria sp.]|uniref:REP-associated tyrosine transposase n=1 Tax=uncultured Tateyamaria sp. TaxID=455651 RepID=UPI0026079B9E|nr:transposase [uncultured Tateyamaria sp.]